MRVRHRNVFLKSSDALPPDDGSAPANAIVDDDGVTYLMDDDGTTYLIDG
ncbi:hypothetical protein [Devosia sp.]|nr:hypothetical protein [Devosia sp.]